MVYYREKQVDDAFFALSHPVRRGILAKLARRDLSVAEAARSFEETPSGITKHLHILERSGLLSRSRQGRVHILHLEPEPLKDVMDWVNKYRKFWERRLDALDAYLHNMSEDKNNDP